MNGPVVAPLALAASGGLALAGFNGTAASNARLAVIPMQDLLQLDGSARMNTPGTSDGNWKWCMRPGDLEKVDAAKLHALAVRTGRA